ncbi:hypothetical protein OIU84_021183 [Salix udensis]|uniref:Cytochrome b561 domain-containing protein n=1 Tax=Salix udensis TaxID=889485 RepID=A0AAD6PHY2_9ROSI|nr:hypothetical protein OIU84_021183 [Salix udensis]
MATSVPTSPAPLLLLARISGLLVSALVISWALLFKSSFRPQSTSQEDLIYAVLHPLLMVIGLILISGEAILVHKWLPGSRGFKKSVHLCLQGLALACGIFGIWTKFHGQRWDCGKLFQFAFLDGFNLHFLVWSSVVDGFHELLASRRDAGSEDNSVTMAHLSWSLHIRASRGNSRNRTAGKDYVLANKERRIETHSRIDGC